MNSRMTRDQLISEIDKRKPWYQRIEFPEYGVTTTDKPEWARIDSAPDNIFPGMTHVDASIMRPVPKWNYIRKYLPDLNNKKILEIGCSNGFFSFEFSKLGADVVYGLDLHITENAHFARNVLQLEGKVEFLEGDFLYMKHHSSPFLCSYSNNHSDEIPDVDVVFASAVLTHMPYPYFAIDKMLKTANEFLIIDEQLLNLGNNQMTLCSFNWPYGHFVHSFMFNLDMYKSYFLRIGVPEENINLNVYPEDKSVSSSKVCIVISTDFDKSKLNAFHP